MCGVKHNKRNKNLEENVLMCFVLFLKKLILRMLGNADTVKDTSMFEYTKE